MFKLYDKRYLGLVLPIVILLSMIAIPYITIINGKEVLLETIPYDPTDIFRGDYVELQYKISELDESYLKEGIEGYDSENYNRQRMYAVLKDNNGIYDVEYLTKYKPIDALYIKCDVFIYKSYDRIINGDESGKVTNEYDLDIDYNINRFFLKEGTGSDLERESLRGNLIGKIKVYKGNAVLIDILEK